MEKYLPLGLLSVFTLKVMIFSASLADMGIVLGLAGLLALKDHLDKQKTIRQIQDETNKSLEDMKYTLKLQNDVIEKMARAADEQRTSTAGLKLAQGMRKVVGV